LGKMVLQGEKIFKCFKIGTRRVSFQKKKGLRFLGRMQKTGGTVGKKDLSEIKNKLEQEIY
jgi:hypothetical protein